MKCTYCHAALPDDAKFCAECGHSVDAAPAKVFCPNCGAALAPDECFCSNCGTKCGAESAAESVPQTKPVSKAKLPRWLLPIAGVLAAAVLIAALFALIPGKSVAQVAYLRDGQLQHLHLSNKAEPREVTNRLDESTAYSALFNYTYFSEDGSKLFYPDRIEEDTYTLYCLDTTRRENEPVKIDSGISGYYKFNKDGDRVAYLKGGKLYLHDLKEKTKIASDVASFQISADGKTLVYLTGDSGDYRLYLKKGDKEEVKLASGVTSLSHVNGDFSTILFRKEDKLYISKNGREPEKIASDVTSVWESYDSGACYFIKEEDRVSYWSLLTDDVGGEDSSWVKSSYSDSYTESPVSELYYFDGKETTLVTATARSLLSYHEEEGRLVISALPDDELPRIRVSEFLKGTDSISSLVTEAYMEASRVYVLDKGKMTEIGLEDVNHLQMSRSGKKILAATELDKETGTFDLVEVTLSGSKVTSADKLDEDVASFAFLGESDNYVYLKVSEDAENSTLAELYESNHFELYHNGEKVCEEVTNFIRWSKDGKRVYYMDDYDADDYSGTLHCWDGKNSTKIQSDVYSGVMTAIDSRQILFLQDYSSKSGESDLILWKGKEAVKLDKDVRNIIAVYLP